MGHQKQINKLQSDQNDTRNKAELVEQNLDLVEEALKIINSMIASKLDWDEISHLLKEAKLKKDKVASAITSLKLEQNKIVMLLSNRQFLSEMHQNSNNDQDSLFSDDEEDDIDIDPDEIVEAKIELDLNLNVYGNI